MPAISCPVQGHNASETGFRLYTVYMQYVTVGQVIALELFQVSCPQLISQPGSDANNELVRWMHILETARPEGLLPGGEFILTTATFLDHAAMSERDGIVAANQFLDAIEETGAVAVAAEVLHDREHVVQVLTQAAQHRRIPVYILPNRIRFVELTQFVHENIAAARLEEVETDRRIHEAFTRLSMGSANIDRIVSEATTLLDCTVKWEASEDHTETSVVAEHAVVAGEEVLGRLITTGTCQADDSLVRTVLERAAQAVAISILARRSQQELRRSTAASLFYQLRRTTDLSEQEVLWRLAETFGEPEPRATRWLPLVFRVWGGSSSEEVLNRWSGVLLDVLEQVGAARKVPVFAARSEIGVVDVLLPLQSSATPETLMDIIRTRFNARLRGQGNLVAGLGPEASSAKEAAEKLVNSAQIAQAAQAYVTVSGSRQVHFAAKDLGLSGLLATLQDNEQLMAFIATEFEGLIASTPTQQEFHDQLQLVEAVVTSASKAALARTLHLSRPALYSRIKRLEKRLGYSLDGDPEQRTATHLALLGYKMNPDAMYAQLRQRAGQPKGPIKRT